MRSGFYNNISHEFRTPLTLIVSPIQKIIAETKENHPHKQLFHTIQHHASRLLYLVNQLLDIAKLEANQMTLEVQPADIISFVHHKACSFISLAESKDIDYQITMPQGPQWLYIDQDKTETIVNNLLSNAFKFTPPQGKVSVTLEFIGLTEPDKLLAQITVSDTGIGIASDQLNRIFDRFYQTPDAQASQWRGTGIGLSLTKELIELYQGTITVMSEPGKGASFMVKLPLSKAGPLGEGLHATAPHPDPSNEYRGGEEPNQALEVSPGEAVVMNASTTPDTSAGTELQTDYILLIEDHVQMRSFIKSILQEKTDYYILEASNGEEGYKLALEAVPDLIISDLMMPFLSGTELCRKLKQNETTRHIPIILLTAKASIESKVEGLQTGADDYITKPFDPGELLIRINNLIASRKKLREHFSREIILQPAAIAITSADEKFLQRVMQVIHAHMSDHTFSVEAFSHEMGISRMQLLRKLKALTNQSPADFIRVMRLKRACELLTIKAGTIAEIAYQVGFNDPSYFAKSFYKHYGVTPSEFNARTAGK
jgi:DNA-binding response OmpR family regulator